MEIIEINQENWNEYTNNKEVLIDFYAKWCGPCKMLAPELEKIKNQIQILKVNIDENMELCQKFGIMSVPTLIYLKKDGDYKINSGYVNSEKILEWIRK